MNIPGISEIYVINLALRPNRWQRALQEFGKYAISPKRQKAINGWQIPLEEKNALASPSLLGGEIGCLLSHLSIYQEALMKKHSVIWVCEDDVELTGNIHELPFLIEELRTLDPNWDLLYTDFFYIPNFTSSQVISDHFLRVQNRLGAHSILFSSAGLEKVTAYLSSSPFWAPIDVCIHKTPSLRQYALTNNLTKVSGIGSDTTWEPILNL